MSETPEQPFVERRSDNRYITLATNVNTYCHALCDALYGDFITVRCTDNNYN